MVECAKTIIICLLSITIYHSLMTMLITWMIWIGAMASIICLLFATNVVDVEDVGKTNITNIHIREINTNKEQIPMAVPIMGADNQVIALMLQERPLPVKGILGPECYANSCSS